MFGKLYRKIYANLIHPVINSVAPVQQVSWGVAVGMFVGLTPTMGVQMYIVMMIWFFARYVLRIRFNLPVGAALVWITNPVTVIPIYYMFLVTGYPVLDMLGLRNGDALTYEIFASRLQFIMDSGGTGQVIEQGTQFLLVELGWPMLVGGFVYAMPVAIFSYFFTMKWLTEYRKAKAIKEGLSYEQWREKHETDGK